jgi:hypothetical protein
MGCVGSNFFFFFFFFFLGRNFSMMQIQGDPPHATRAKGVKVSPET